MSVYMSTSSSCTFRANKRIIGSIVHAEAMKYWTIFHMLEFNGVLPTALAPGKEAFMKD